MFTKGNKWGKGRPKGGHNRPNPQKIVAKAWVEGNLQYKLKDCQKPIYDTIRTTKSRKLVIHCSRRFGKSFLLALVAMEDAIREPGCQISILCPTMKNLKTIMKPIFQELLKDCPEELRPEYIVMDGKWVFPNESEIYLFGIEGGNIENIRGQRTKKALIDEAGFVGNLKYIVDSVLMPQLLTTNGSVVLSSSSPLSPDHEFVDYIQDAIKNSTYFKFTIDQAGYDPKLVSEFAIEAGGRASTTFRREYMCELVLDEERALCPEWKDEYVQEIQRDDFFQYYGKYMALDSGVRDFTVAEFGYYDFKKATLFIEDEFWAQGADVRTDVIVENCKRIETQLEYRFDDVSRIADNDNLILIQDLTNFHNYPIQSIQDKDSLEAMVNQVRLMVNQGRIIIHPRCKLLIATLKHGMWDKIRQGFDRSTHLGHMDAFASLMYMVRTLNTFLNPIPSYLGKNPYTMHLESRFEPNQDIREQWRNLLNVNDKPDPDSPY